MDLLTIILYIQGVLYIIDQKYRIGVKNTKISDLKYTEPFLID